MEIFTVYLCKPAHLLAVKDALYTKEIGWWKHFLEINLKHYDVLFCFYYSWHLFASLPLENNQSPLPPPAVWVFLFRHGPRLPVLHLSTCIKWLNEAKSIHSSSRLPLIHLFVLWSPRVCRLVSKRGCSFGLRDGYDSPVSGFWYLLRQRSADTKNVVPV